MHNTTIQQPLSTVYLNSNPTIVILQSEVWFVRKHAIRMSISTVQRTIVNANVYGLESTVREAMDIPLYCKRGRGVHADTDCCVTD